LLHFAFSAIFLAALAPVATVVATTATAPTALFIALGRSLLWSSAGSLGVECIGLGGYCLLSLVLAVAFAAGLAFAPFLALLVLLFAALVVGLDGIAALAVAVTPFAPLATAFARLLLAGIVTLGFAAGGAFAPLAAVAAFGAFTAATEIGRASCRERV
jgi:hypothetical protein